MFPSPCNAREATTMRMSFEGLPKGLGMGAQFSVHAEFPFRIKDLLRNQAGGFAIIVFPTPDPLRPLPDKDLRLIFKGLPIRFQEMRGGLWYFAFWHDY